MYDLLFSCMPSLLGPRRPSRGGRQDLPGLQCLPASRGGCVKRVRSRPSGLLPRGTGLPPFPFPPRHARKLPPHSRHKHPTPPTTSAPPRVPTTTIAADKRIESDVIAAGRRAFWRGVPQDHFRNLSPNANNHRFGREILHGKQEYRTIPEEKLVDVSIEIPVKVHRPLTKRMKTVLSPPDPTSHWLIKHMVTAKTDRPSSPSYIQPSFVDVVVTASPYHVEISPPTTPQTFLSMFPPVSPRTFAVSTTPKSRVKTYYNSIFSDVSIHQNSSIPAYVQLFTAKPRKISTTSRTTKVKIYPTLFLKPTSKKTQPKPVNPSKLSSVTKSSSTQNKTSTSTPSVPHFSPTRKPGKKAVKRQKVRKFIRHSLPKSISITENYKEVDKNNKISLAKSSNIVAKEIIALFNT